tara:strand:+ start:3723 stop:4181 length:459 start_codon:yes stop_codon:yes gene_type:complete
MINITPAWQLKYFQLAKTIANFSKDPCQKVGAVAIGNYGQVLSQGYNGFPRKFSDKEEFYSNKLIKNNFIIHAEMNCIYNAALTGVSLDQALLFVYGLHICHECAKGIIQAGFSKVYSKGPAAYSKKWNESFKLSEESFKKAGIIYKKININ